MSVKAPNCEVKMKKMKRLSYFNCKYVHNCKGIILICIYQPAIFFFWPSLSDWMKGGCEKSLLSFLPKPSTLI